MGAKIDQCVVTDIPADEDAVLRAPDVTHNPRRLQPAAGVETVARSDFRCASGTGFTQGFNFGRPAVSADMPGLFARSLIMECAR